MRVFFRPSRLAGQVAAWCVACPAIAFAATHDEEVFSWYPLTPGHRWTYEWTSKSGDPQNPKVSRWTAKVTVKERIQTPEGLVIVRELKTQGKANPSFFEYRDGVPYLVRNQCLFPLNGVWNGEKHVFTSGLHEYIGQISPDFCFPLALGKSWQGLGDCRWVVAGIGLAPDGPRLDILNKAFRVSCETSTSKAYVWFQKAVGVLASWGWHKGTFTEELGVLEDSGGP